MNGNPPKSPVGLAASMAGGAAVGASVGAGASWMAGAGAAGAGALAGGVLGGCSFGVGYLSKDASVGGKVRAAASSLYDICATFTGSALSLGTAFNLQAELTSAVIRSIELHRGEPLQPSERALVKGAFDGIAWSALSPAVGFSAGAVGALFQTLRRAINRAFAECGATAPLQRVASPGYLMTMMDWAAVSLAAGAAVRAYQGSMAALDHHPFQITASSALDSPPASWVAGIGGAAAVAMGYLTTGLAERNNGGLQMAAIPPFSLANARDLVTSRITSMARSGLVQVGALTGALLWTIKDVLAAPGGVLQMTGLSDEAVSTAAAGLTALIIGPMAHEWFTQARRNDAGPPGLGMERQLAAVTDAKIETQVDRVTAELHEAEAERSSPHDGDGVTELSRGFLEAVSTVFCVGSAIGAAVNADKFKLEDSALREMMDMSASVGGPSVVMGLMFQMIALRAATNWQGRDDPQSHRAASAVAGMSAGAIIGGAAAGGALNWASLPAYALGAGGAVAADIVRRRYGGTAGYEQRAAPLALDMKNLQRNGRGRRINEEFLPFQLRKWAENIGEPVLGRPHRIAAGAGVPGVAHAAAVVPDVVPDNVPDVVLEVAPAGPHAAHGAAAPLQVEGPDDEVVHEGKYAGEFVDDKGGESKASEESLRPANFRQSERVIRIHRTPVKPEELSINRSPLNPRKVTIHRTPAKPDESHDLHEVRAPSDRKDEAIPAEEPRIGVELEMVTPKKFKPGVRMTITPKPEVNSAPQRDPEEPKA